MSLMLQQIQRRLQTDFTEDVPQKTRDSYKDEKYGYAAAYGALTAEYTRLLLELRAVVRALESTERRETALGMAVEYHAPSVQPGLDLELLRATDTYENWLVDHPDPSHQDWASVRRSLDNEELSAEKVSEDTHESIA